MVLNQAYSAMPNRRLNKGSSGTQQDSQVHLRVGEFHVLLNVIFDRVEFD